ncbi:hypothetical protein BGW38_008400, partial [Lunasporangiospora selenospora]
LKGMFSFEETFSAPDLLPDKLPQQLFMLPAIEALVSVQIYDTNGIPILCTSLPLTNAVSLQSPTIAIASASIAAASIALAIITSIVASFSSAALLSSIHLTTNPGGAGASAGVHTASLSPTLWDVVSYSQFIAMSGSLDMECPELLKQWTQNFGWSLGLVRVDGWNKVIDELRTRVSPTTIEDNAEDSEFRSNQDKAEDGRVLLHQSLQRHNDSVLTKESTTLVSAKSIWESKSGPVIELSHSLTSASVQPMVSTNFNKRQSAGADLLLPSLQDISLMNRANEASGLTPLRTSNRAMEPASSSAKAPDSVTLRPPISWPEGGSMQIGLPSFGQRHGVPPKNMFMTSLFLFLILLLATSFVAFIIRISLEVYARFRPGKFTKFRRRYSAHYAGILLRVVLLAFFGVATMAFFQLTLHDIWPITTLAVLTLLLFFGLLTYATLRLRRAGGTSLVFDEGIRSKYGALYDQYALSIYWFFVPALLYQVFKAAIVGLGHNSPETAAPQVHHRGSTSAWVQMALMLLVEISFTSLLLWKRPFAARVPNRLNALLGCARILNVVLLSVMIEGTAASTVSRTVVGIVITCIQALVMLLLACLVLYQLLREDTMAHEYKYDNDDNMSPGRRASEHPRHPDGSIATLVGMMGIGQNPTIYCTPASDDEEERSEKYARKSTPPPKRHGFECSEYGASFGNKIQVKQAKSIEQVLNEHRDSSEECSQESLADDSNGTREQDYNKTSELLATNSSAINCANFSEESSSEHRCSTVVTPRKDSEGPWVQSAYMTRRSSKGKCYLGQTPTSSSIVTLSKSIDSQFQGDILATQPRRPSSLGWSLGSRPSSASFDMHAALDAVRQKVRREEHRSSVASEARLHSLRLSMLMDSSPIFKPIYIPESLLDGPPSPSALRPQRTSISSAALLTPPSLSPVLPRFSRLAFDARDEESGPSEASSSNEKSRAESDSRSVVDSEEEVSSPESETSSQASGLVPPTMATTTHINFSEYRFPDERPLLSQSITAVQRSIHPLSPFHPDFQHPDDVYNISLPSPNEAGPLYLTTRPSSIVRVLETGDGATNVPNMPQNEPRREPGPQCAPLSYGSRVMAPRRRPAAARGLMIDTSPKAILRMATTTSTQAMPPPRIPSLYIPQTPLSTAVNNGLSSALQDPASGSSTARSFSLPVIVTSNHDYPLAATPCTSIVEVASTSNSSISSTESQEPVVKRHSKSFSTGAGTATVEWSLAEVSPLTPLSSSRESSNKAKETTRPSPSCQRALTMTPLAQSSGPLTVSHVRRKSSRSAQK